MNSMMEVTQPARAQSGHSVLGERQASFPIGGKIRAGIMVLTSTAKQKAGAQKLYDDMRGSGASWDAIGLALKDKFKFERSPLTPRNVPYFTVRPGDFRVPDTAARLLELYGQDRGEGVQLYRLPVVFPADFWLTIMPHKLACYTRSELLYWSEYDADGARHCKAHGAVPMVGEGKNRRAQRVFGGRPVIDRPDNQGVCDPQNCPEYQNRKCNMSGQFLFYVPGIAGSSVLALPTTSYYSLEQVRQQLEMVAYISGGRISGTVHGQPVFYLTKAQRDISHIDPDTGKAKKVKQWLIEVEANLDMVRLFASREPRAALAHGNEAAALLSGRGEAPASPEPEFDAPAPAADASASGHADDADVIAIKQLRETVFGQLQDMDIAPTTFAVYAGKQWGDEWGKTRATLTQARDILEQAKDNPALRDEIANDDVPF